MSATGLFGGSFNPPHLGHLICAQQAAEQLQLDRVVLVPLHTPTHRELDGDPGADARLALCEAAVTADDRLQVSAIEVERGGPSYTVEMLRQWRRQQPDDRLTLIVGEDLAGGFEQWREPAAILDLATLAIAARAGELPGPSVGELAARHDGATVVEFQMTRVDISSSLVRDRVAEGLPIDYLVAPDVASLIAANGWYR